MRTIEKMLLALLTDTKTGELEDVHRLQERWLVGAAIAMNAALALMLFLGMGAGQ